MARSKQNVRTLSLVVCTFTFLLIGAAVFDALESSMDDRHQEVLGDIKSKMMDKYRMDETDYKVLETVILKMKPHKAGPQWKFVGALYFATVVLVMIGYGHSTPATIGGKAFVLLYSIIGIPMGLVMFQHIGERLNKGASIVIRRIKSVFGRKSQQVSQIELMMATFFLSTIITTSGAAMFSHYERWSYFESFYYCFITLTTIGFGDYVALQKDHALSEKPGYVAMVLIFILFGLAVLAASMNLLVLRFMTMNTENIKPSDLDNNLWGSALSLDNVCRNLDNSQDEGGNTGDTLSFASQLSVCSCTCYPRYSSRLSDSYRGHDSPRRLSHLMDPVPGQPPYITEVRNDLPLNHSSPTDFFGRYLKRASI